MKVKLVKESLYEVNFEGGSGNDPKREFKFPLIIDTKDFMPELERFGIHKVVVGQNAHGGLVLAHNEKQDHSNHIQVLNSLDGDWYLDWLDGNGKSQEVRHQYGTNDDWGDLFQTNIDEFIQMSQELKDNEWVDLSNYDGETKKLHNMLLNNYNGDTSRKAKERLALSIMKNGEN